MTQLHRESHEVDVCIIGGGMAGLCAALAAARRGASTALVHDRPVLGGNASSEVRMWICGAHGAHNKETGILEEIQLENLYHNPGLNYSIWDSVLWAKARFQPGLQLFLNCSCASAAVETTSDGPQIRSIQAWQLTTQTWHTIHARLFIDCSGDSILAALTPAEFRTGRESRQEFNEDIEPEIADARTMGNSLLIQLRRTDEPQPYTPPRWAYKFTSPADLPHRIQGVNAHNFWWLEVGGLQDTIRDAEAIRDELMRIGHGVWDYLKNHAPERAKAENWALDWMGSLPGKRENRRYVGAHTLTQNDIRAGGQFEDVVAYGGWSMDDHHPAGLYYPGEPTIFHPAPSPYGIPYLCLTSRSVSNLLFAGRNISVTHAALSSTRVMATCALLGQAAGTAAAICTRRRCLPAALHRGAGLAALQAALMADDCWLPGLTRAISPLARAARLSSNGDGAALVLDGMDRDRPDEPHAWEGEPGSLLEFRWPHAAAVESLRLVFDSNLNNDKRMPCSYPQKGSRTAVPSSLVRAFRVEAEVEPAVWRVVFRTGENYQRMLRVAVRCRATALRFIPESTWGDAAVRVFGCEPSSEAEPDLPVAPDGPPFSRVRESLPARDLAPPDNGLEPTQRRSKHSA